METFEELVEISQIPHESRLETQLSYLLNNNVALQGQCNALTDCFKFLEYSTANPTAL